MAPRTSKGKGPAKATLTAAAAAAASSAVAPSSSSRFTGEFYDLYNDLLVAKNELLVSDAGIERRRTIAQLGTCLVRLLFISFNSLLTLSLEQICAVPGSHDRALLLWMEYHSD
jgi:hypothetical protein